MFTKMVTMFLYIKLECNPLCTYCYQATLYKFLRGVEVLNLQNLRQYVEDLLSEAGKRFMVNSITDECAIWFRGSVHIPEHSRSLSKVIS